MNLEETKNIVSKMFNVSWVKWIHEGTKKAENTFEKTFNSVISTIIPMHCARCLNLNGCCFTSDKSPTVPLHMKCLCKIVNVGSISPKIVYALEKFTKYIFDKSKSKGKKDLFETWGYSIIDSEKLVQEFAK